jgi:hypothetical protein
MGEEIQKSHFTPEDFQEFKERLHRETEILQSWFEQGKFTGGAPTVGFELEAWLVDEGYLPSPKNEEFLRLLGDETTVPELSRFNIEFNGTPRVVAPNLLNQIHGELDRIFDNFEDCARRLQDHVLTVGILPTLKDEMLTLENMSPLRRFHALNQQVLRLRHFKPMKIDILGFDHLLAYHRDVMLESCATSFQLHLQVDPQLALRFFNAALIASSFTVAVSANSPFLFGRELWEETRIPLFEQAVELESGREGQGQKLGRVTFGSGYARNSLFEFFRENLEAYPVLLPILFDHPAEQLSHLRLHNGTIWRWNRPLIGLDETGQPSLRIEHRVMAASPSRADATADLAFFLGLAQKLAHREPAPESLIPFEIARKNFYNAAREGLKAKAEWFDGRRVSIDDLVKGELLSMAAEGLAELGVSEASIEHYLMNILSHRVQSLQTGTFWQKNFIHRHGRDFPAMTQAYSERQRLGHPVHEWPL